MTVTCTAGAPYTYTGSAQTPCTAGATGVGMSAVDVSGSLSYSNNTNAGPATASATWAGDTNHTGNTGNGGFTIGQAASTVTVGCTVGAPFTYTGSPQTPCSATATGVGMSAVDVTSSLVYSNNTNAGPATASANWAGDPNHTGNTGNGGFTIGQAPSTTVVTCGAGPFTYTGSAQTPCTASVTGAGGLSQSLTVNYSNNTNPGTATASASYVGDANHVGSADSKNFAIAYGLCSASVGTGGTILPPINSDGTSVYQRKGGSTIPVKFRVCDAYGNSISNSAAVFAGTGGALSMLSSVRGTVTSVNESGITEIPDAAFRWDASSKQWMYNMATSNLSSGYSYVFRINLTSGSIQFQIGVK